MKLTKEAKEYIKIVVEETASRLHSEDYIRRIVSEIINEIKLEDRMRKVENKVFNGFGMRINILFGLYAVILAMLVKLAFF